MEIYISTVHSLKELEILSEIRFGYLYPYKLAGMGEPWIEKMPDTHTLLKQKGISAILTLTEEDTYGALHKKAGFLHFHEPINDCEPPSVEGMNRALDFIDTCLDRDAGVAVHCLEGRGRTGTILCAWLGIKEQLLPEQAIERINTLRFHTVLTPSQKSFLTEYLGAP